MTKSDDNQIKRGRTQIIQIVQTPLAFFALVVLVSEVMLGVIAGSSSDWLERTFLIGFMIALLIFLSIVVAYFAKSHPEALSGVRYIPEASDALREEITRLTQANEEIIVRTDMQIANLSEENRMLKSELENYRSLRARLLGLLAGGRKLSLSDIESTLNKYGQTPMISRSKILAALGVLAKGEEIEGDELGLGYYRRPKK